VLLVSCRGLRRGRCVVDQFLVVSVAFWVCRSVFCFLLGDGVGLVDPPPAYHLLPSFPNMRKTAAVFVCTSSPLLRFFSPLLSFFPKNLPTSERPRNLVPHFFTPPPPPPFFFSPHPFQASPPAHSPCFAAVPLKTFPLSGRRRLSVTHVFRMPLPPIHRQCAQPLYFLHHVSGKPPPNASSFGFVAPRPVPSSFTVIHGTTHGSCCFFSAHPQRYSPPSANFRSFPAPLSPLLPLNVLHKARAKLRSSSPLSHQWAQNNSLIFFSFTFRLPTSFNPGALPHFLIFPPPFQNIEGKLPLLCHTFITLCGALWLLVHPYSPPPGWPAPSPVTPIPVAVFTPGLPLWLHLSLSRYPFPFAESLPTWALPLPIFLAAPFLVFFTQ